MHRIAPPTVQSSSDRARSDRAVSVHPVSVHPVSVPAVSVPAVSEHRRVLWLRAAVGALVVLMLIAVGVSVRHIERDLDRRVRASLEAAEYVGLSVSFAGQDATVSCGVPVSDPTAVVALIEDVRGVREARLGASCRAGGRRTAGAGPVVASVVPAPSSTEADDGPSPGQGQSGTSHELSLAVTAELRDGRASLSGVVPDRRHRDALIAAAETALTPANVSSEIEIDPDSAIGADDVDAALAGLATLIASASAELVSGTVSLHRGDLSLRGVFATDDQRETLEAVAEQTGASIAITDRTAATDADAAALADLLNRLVNEDPILFETASAVLTADAGGVLDRVAAVAERYGDIAIGVVGYTDSRGDAATNLELSRQRAVAVADALVARGVTAVLTAAGRGERSPVIVDGVEDAEASRRVEFIVGADAP